MATVSVTKMPTTPSSTQSKKQEDIDFEVKTIIGNLNREWSLDLPVPEEVGSPEKRGNHKEQRCFNMIYFLVCKSQAYPPVREFVFEAEILYSGWINKPKAERGVVPEATRHKMKPVTSDERLKLLHVLFTLLFEKSEAIKTQHKASPLRWRTSFDGNNPPTSNVDDSPVPFPKMKHDSKRQRDEQNAEPTSPKKKVKTPDKEKTEALAAKSANAMLPPPRGRPVQEPKGWRSANTSFESNATSAVFSNASQSFSRSRSRLPDTQETIPDIEDLNVQTQEDPSSATVGEEKATVDKENATTEKESHTSSEFGIGSSFERELAQTSDPAGLMQGSEIDSQNVDDELSQDVGEITIDPTTIDPTGDLPGTISNEDILKERLDDVFPELPPCLGSASFAITYEIIRVFLHAGVPLTEVQIPDPAPFSDYDFLWKALRSLPALKDKEFPERSERQAWLAAQANYAKGPHGVLLSGSLKFNSSGPTEPFFKLRLQPMKLDLSHRLGRRFGHDRFLELDIPHLSGRHVPKLLQILGDRGRDIVIEHLVDGAHRLCGRTWKPYHCKPKERNRKRDILKDYNDDDPAAVATAHRVFFFAVDGNGFRIVKRPSHELSDAQSHFKLDIPSLLNLLRPTRKNTHQSYLKLFSRTALALSRNTATVVLERSQIHDKDDIYCGKHIIPDGSGREEDVVCDKHNMTDGAGRMSYALALEIARKLGLTYLPCGFQGRLGEAKGFWTIDHRDRSNKIWIETYASQRKWTRSMKRGGESDDSSHLTFEVNRPSGPLKSADLNLQLLPLLVDRAKNKAEMQKSIANLLEGGLNESLAALRDGMTDGPSLRQWTGESNSSVKEKLKAGQIPFRGGLPSTIEERLNMMLDAGFQPNSLYFVKEMAKTLFKRKCDELKKRLNITVGKSTYAYMVPDFWGVLAPDEVYIDFSSFKDDVSGFTGVRLNGDEVLVARSPAHFVSDVQKVKAVVKAELVGLQDVIIFPTRAFVGQPSLAEKLSGGDYDGDLAWVCWEPSIVQNFETAEVPKQPNLVEEGYITEDKTKYKDLVKGQQDPVSFYLKKAFSFNMQQSMLGICTSFKESACYTSESVSSVAAIYMSTLLSSLVDQAKQGYTFDDVAYQRFKDERVKIKPRKPAYKTDHLDTKSKHIIDRLMIVADNAIHKALQEFHESFADPPFWDEDLARGYKVARGKAVTNDEWKRLLDQMDKELRAIKDDWTRHFARAPNDETVPTFAPFRDQCFEKYQAIQPCEDGLLAQALLPDDPGRHPDSTEWALLKASALFALYHRKYVSNLVWWMAGKQLCQIKTQYSKIGALHAVTPSMMINLKVNNTIIKMLKVEDGPLYPDGSGVSTIGELDEVEDDD